MYTYTPSMSDLSRLDVTHQGLGSGDISDWNATPESACCVESACVALFPATCVHVGTGASGAACRKARLLTHVHSLLLSGGVAYMHTVRAVWARQGRAAQGRARQGRTCHVAEPLLEQILGHVPALQVDV